MAGTQRVADWAATYIASIRQDASYYLENGRVAGPRVYLGLIAMLRTRNGRSRLVRNPYPWGNIPNFIFSIST
jgi:hypothetical protein